MEVMDVVALLLPNPKKLIKAGLEISSADGEDWELFAQIITIDDAEFLNGVSWGSVCPVWTDWIISVPGSVVKNIVHILDKNIISD